MDYSSIDSELLESLDFLRPPVKRAFRNTNRSTTADFVGHINNTIALKDFRKKISKDCKFPQPKIRTAESSTSLILKKTTERDIPQQDTVLSYTNLIGRRFQNPKNLHTYSTFSKEKPSIKVTVIPKTGSTHPSSYASKKRRHFSKRIHTTVSNQESSIQTKNVYLVVQGRKREKVYEIKTTRSAKLNTHSKNDIKDEIIPIEQRSSLKLLLDSLNMDIEKDTTRYKTTDSDKYVEFSRILNRNGKYSDCKYWDAIRVNKDCSCLKEDSRERALNLGDSKSRIRITGHLGLTEDDRYVLRCAATVNDRPIGTVVDHSSHAPASCGCREDKKLNICERDNCSTRCYNAATYCTQKRDSNIQADFPNEKKREMPFVPRDMQSKESQATQVNFNSIELSDVPKYKNQFNTNKDEIIQCFRTNVDTHASLTDHGSDSNPLNNSQSPLVIISVYPMQDCCDTVKVVKNYQDETQYSSQRKPNIPAYNFQRPSSGTRQNNDQKNNLSYNFQRPSSGTRRTNEKKTDNKVSRYRSRPPSPKNKTMSKTNVTGTRILRTNTWKASPTRDVSPHTGRQNRQMRSNQDQTFSKDHSALNKTRQRLGSPTIKHPKETIGINTDHNITKKILVDSYTKKLTDYWKSTETKSTVPKSYPSKVTIDIDGDNEFYNVLFQQANSTTDLNVRKTIKGNANKKHTTKIERGSPPILKILMNEELRRSSPVQCKPQQKDAQKIEQTFSRLQLRDSIEISHRRDKLSADNANGIKNSKIYDDNAPIKHYRGDSCPIADPIKRDKEIRALLGVDNGVYTSATPALKIEEKNVAVPLHYFYGKKCEKKIVAGINIMEMPEPPCVCCDTRKYYTSNSNFDLQRQISQQQKFQMEQPRAARSTHFASPRVPSHNKKINATSSQIDKEIAEHQPESSDSASPEEKSPSPDPVVESPSPAIQKVPSKKHVSKSRKSKAKSTGTQYETQVQRTSLYQQLILNRNIQVFLQVEQFSKQKPLILSRKQYDKVKRTIDSTIANKTGREYKRKKYICKTSLVSVGNVRRKTNTGQPLHYDKQSQTDRRELARNVKKSSSVSNKSREGRSRHDDTMVLFAKKAMNGNVETTVTPPRQVSSSLDVQYASTSYIKRVTFSSTNVEAGSTCPPTQQKESHSIHTIFKGRRKCPTPNLGTSVFSLYSEDNNAMISPQPLAMVQDSKPRKPFLRRLMSCLVMRSTRASELNNITNPPAKVPSVDSSFDSYHISTSLGAIEVSSSIYDTSASFYSNHSVYPVNSKMKRGFFSSVREFLTIRKS